METVLAVSLNVLPRVAVEFLLNIIINSKWLEMLVKAVHIEKKNTIVQNEIVASSFSTYNFALLQHAICFSALV